jgi:hypothetical protein
MEGDGGEKMRSAVDNGWLLRALADTKTYYNEAR